MNKKALTITRGIATLVLPLLALFGAFLHPAYAAEGDVTNFECVADGDSYLCEFDVENSWTPDCSSAYNAGLPLVYFCSVDVPAGYCEGGDVVQLTYFDGPVHDDCHFVFSSDDNIVDRTPDMVVDWQETYMSFYMSYSEGENGDFAAVTSNFYIGEDEPPVAIVTPLPDARKNVAYSTTLEISDGTEPYHWTVVSGSLPPGVALGESTGTISGTPTVPGDFAFTAQVADSDPEGPFVATQAYTLKVKGLSIITSLAAGEVGAPYSLTLAPQGGTAPYLWSVFGGSLPAGLTLGASTGVISGTPTIAGMVQFLVKLEDSAAPNPAASYASYKINVVE